MNRLRSRKRSRGQSLAEFALVFPIFALILFGIIDVGRYVFTANQLGNAARDAARAGAVANWPPDCSGLAVTAAREQCVLVVATNRAQGISLQSPAASDIACRRYGRVDTTADGKSEYDSVIIPDAGNCRVNDVLLVTVKSNFTLVTPLIAQFIGNQTITGDAKVTVNN